MAIKTNDVTNIYQITSNSGFDLANDQWAYVIWGRAQTTTGSDYMTIFDCNNLNNSSVALRAYEASFGTLDKRNKMTFRTKDVDGTDVLLDSSAGTSTGVGDSIWRVYVAQRTATDIELWQCELNGTPELIDSQTTPAGYTTVPFSSAGSGLSKDYFFGRNAFGTRPWDNEIAEFSLLKGTSLTSTEIQSIAAGNDITSTSVRNPALSPTIYVPFDDAQGATEADESGNSYHANKTGSPTDATHPYSASGTLVGRPDADVSNAGSWTNSGATTTNLYAEIDESDPDDTDYIQSPASPSNATCVIGVTDMSDPGTNIVRIIVRAKKV